MEKGEGMRIEGGWQERTVRVSESEEAERRRMGVVALRVDVWRIIAEAYKVEVEGREEVDVDEGKVVEVEDEAEAADRRI